MKYTIIGGIVSALSGILTLSTLAEVHAEREYALHSKRSVALHSQHLEPSFGYVMKLNPLRATPSKRERQTRPIDAHSSL